LEARAATNAAATFQAGQSTQAAQATQVAQQVATDAQATLAAQASTQAAQSTATVIQQSTEVALASVGRLLDIPADPEGVTSLAFSPNGQQILSGGLDNTAKVWLVANGELVYQLEAHGGDILSVAFQNDGSEILTGGQDSSYRFWSTQTRAPQGLGLSGAPVRWVAYSPDGQHYAAISGDLLEVSVRRGTSSLIQTGVEFTALAFNGRGDRVVTANREGEVVLWSFGAGSQPQAELEYAEVPQPVIKLAFNSGETNLFGLGLNGDFYIWDARRGNLIQTFRPDDTQLTTFAPHPRRPIVLAFGTQTGAVYLFNLRDQSVIVRYGGHQAAVRALAFSADGFRLASGGDDGRLILWEVR
jgi:WD40 repeat protein